MTDGSTARPQPDAARGGAARRRAAADPGRGRFGQDPHPHPPHRLADPRTRRRAVADPRGHLYQQGGRRNARAPAAAARQARTSRGSAPSMRPACASCAAISAPSAYSNRLHHLRRRRPGAASTRDADRSSNIAEQTLKPRAAAAAIDSAKNRGLLPASLSAAIFPASWSPGSTPAIRSG